MEDSFDQDLLLDTAEHVPKSVLCSRQGKEKFLLFHCLSRLLFLDHPNKKFFPLPH